MQGVEMRLIGVLAQTFGVPPAFFFDDFDESQAGLLQEQVELAMVRDLGVTTAQLRPSSVSPPKSARPSPT